MTVLHSGEPARSRCPERTVRIEPQIVDPGVSNSVCGSKRRADLAICEMHYSASFESQPESAGARIGEDAERWFVVSEAFPGDRLDDTCGGDANQTFALIADPD